MKDFLPIFSEMANIDLASQRAALATVVKVTGSSYRSPGARMLITENGRWYGSISGGCLEGDALRKARQVMSAGKPKTVTYDTSDESNKSLGISLGCNGVIDVLIEPISPADNPLGIFRNLSATNETIALATIYRSTDDLNGERLILKQSGEALLSFSYSELNTMIAHDLTGLFESRKSYTKLYSFNGSTTEVFLELIQPQISLIIFGAGFDARPVSNLAKTLGWNVSVTDECVAHIAPLFFPNADKVSLCQRQFIDRDFPISKHTACVLMSHNYEYDRDVLKKLLQGDAPYIGILGPRKRFDKMVKELADDGTALCAYDYERIHSPIGLDIGAEIPEEIALSIISEIQAKLHQREGSFLKNRSQPIHDRDSSSSQVLKKAYL
jgi:xanthine dehydrogenase accessory factor